MTEGKRYRYRDLKPGDAYYEAWHAYVQRYIHAMAVGFIVMVFLFPVDLFLGVRTNLVGAAFGAGLLTALFRGSVWRCPRCGLRYSSLGRELLDLPHEPFSFSCRHCGLPKWAPDDPEKGEG